MTAVSPAANLREYYRWHSHIYDWTRWAFLFGRRELITLAAQRIQPRRILEVGCGTGTNLLRLAKAFPAAEIVGLDCSAAMLARARRKLRAHGSRVSLQEMCYDRPVNGGRPFDLIVASYCLSMINPGSEEVLGHCRADLSAGGTLALVDFHDSPSPHFRRWMALNHVRMEGQILAALPGRGFGTGSMELRSAYGGLWRWSIGLASRD